MRDERNLYPKPTKCQGQLVAAARKIVKKTIKPQNPIWVKNSIKNVPI